MAQFSLFIALNVFSVLISKSASVIWALNMLWTVCIAASARAFCPAQTYNEPAVFITSCLLIIFTTFPNIFLNTSPTPISFNRGFLLNLHATKICKDAQLLLFAIFVIHKFRRSSAIALQRSDIAVPKHDETTILCHQFASIPDGFKHPFVLIAAFLLVLLQCHHIQLDKLFVLVVLAMPAGSCLLHQEV